MFSGYLLQDVKFILNLSGRSTLGYIHLWKRLDGCNIHIYVIEVVSGDFKNYAQIKESVIALNNRQLDRGHMFGQKPH